ncbi:unnamed protein product [Schistosoma margrebowiei]|uniref:RNase III domain-containing protein n=1 Tax=Schistosoma margrebowiei TaxID=48269 RepID=A0A3P8ERC7_9TREM|nr:unnamed protein product [Schistosoma margrebowiei]
MADVFESILGAIFVDSNGNHQVVSSIIHRFLGKTMTTQLLYHQRYMKMFIIRFYRLKVSAYV